MAKGLSECVATQPFTFRRSTAELICDHCGEVLRRGLDAFSYAFFGMTAMNPAVEHMVTCGRPRSFWTSVFWVPSVDDDLLRLWLAREV